METVSYLTLKDLPPPSKNELGGTYTNQHKDSPKEISPIDETMLKETLLFNKDLEVPEVSPVNAYPVVRLDVDTISDAAAGRLATSLLGHVLFLKNQVPFPVMQLGRIPGGKVNSRAFKQRTELLTSYDTISSHLDTTFSALSTALARCAGHATGKVAQIHMAILVGPSLGTAKSKVILGIDGLETRIWGAREDLPAPTADDNESSEEEDDDEEEEEESNAEGSEGSAEEPEESEDEEDEEQDEDVGGDGDESEESVEEITSSPPPPPYVSYTEEQRFLQNADRLLSRTLADADAEGNGITSEMKPTQTHILIRAPRRFDHPAWIPRQNVTASLDNSLHDFIENSGLTSGLEFQRKRPSKKNKIEGVWITARSGIRQPPATDENVSKLQETSEDADEMIWWSWDGKFVGFDNW